MERIEGLVAELDERVEFLGWVAWALADDDPESDELVDWEEFFS